jgi:hypothetical protein
VLLCDRVKEFEVRKVQRVLSTSTLFAKLAALFAASVATFGLSGCLVAGYSSGGGWFVWPGSLGLLVIIVLIVFLIRRR